MEFSEKGRKVAEEFVTDPKDKYKEKYGSEALEKALSVVKELEDLAEAVFKKKGISLYGHEKSLWKQGMVEGLGYGMFVGATSGELDLVKKVVELTEKEINKGEQK